MGRNILIDWKYQGQLVLKHLQKVKGYLVDTCLYGQDMYQNICKKLIESKLNKEAILITLPSIKVKSDLKL
jgi:hypothetical protein